jgi:hypothetical protein
MNNEPVAWMHKTYFQNGLYEEDLVWSKIDESSIPLYTHPAKTLTDEEIEEVMYKCDWAYDPVNFAKAILRKASEK